MGSGHTGAVPIGIYRLSGPKQSSFVLSFPGEFGIDVGLNTAGPDSNGKRSLRSGALDLLLAAVLMTRDSPAYDAIESDPRA
jgi:hypothetical protein